MKRFSQVSSVAAIAAVASSVFAADRTWLDQYDDWSTANRWSPAGVPGVGDRAIVGALPGPHDALVRLDQNAIVSALDIFGQGGVNTEGWWMDVNGPARIDGSGSDGFDEFFARLRVTNGAGPIDFRANSLQIGSEGMLLMSESPVVQIDGGVTIAADGDLYGSGRFNASGAFVNNGDIHPFLGDMTIDIGNFNIDLDGAGEGELIINDAGTDFELVAGALTDPFDGEVFVGGTSALTMSLNSPWTLGPAGYLSAAWPQSEGHFSTVLGAALTIAGDVNVWGRDNTLRFQVPVTIEGTATIETGEFGADPSNTIQFNNDTTINGGFFDVADTARFEFNDTTIINDGTFVLGEGSELAFDGPTIVVSGDFATFSEDAADGAILFNGPTTWSGTIFALGVSRQMGDATVSTATTINATVFDMDGGGADWTINNSLTVNAQAIDELALPNAFNTAMTVGGNLFARFTPNLGPNTTWHMNGQLTIGGDPALFTTRIAGSPMQVGGTMSMTGARAHIAANMTLASGSTTTIPAAAILRVGAMTEVQSGAAISGSGTLRNAAAGTLNLDDGASLGSVGVYNEGTLMVDAPPGIASVARYESVASSVFQVNIAGYAAGSEYDRLVVTQGPATLAGALAVDHFDGDAEEFVPVVGDEFTIIAAVGGINGAFTANPTSCAAGRTFSWTVVYGANDVRLRLDAIDECCPPDVSGDGNIDLTDLAILLSNFGLGSNATQPMGDLDFDGDVDLTDLAILLSLFGTACGG
ncbi:MAG: dockerin type I domain-containing protein [Phycisphaerae bacterium]